MNPFDNWKKEIYGTDSASSELESKKEFENELRCEFKMILRYLEADDSVKLNYMFKLIDGDRFKLYIKNLQNIIDEFYDSMSAKIEVNNLACVDVFHKFILDQKVCSEINFVKFCKKNKVDYKRYIGEIE